MFGQLRHCRWLISVLITYGIGGHAQSHQRHRRKRALLVIGSSLIMKQQVAFST